MERWHTLHTVTWKTVNTQKTAKVRKYHANTNSITTSDHSSYTTSTYIPGNISLGNQSTQYSTFCFLNPVPQQIASVTCQLVEWRIKRPSRNTTSRGTFLVSFITKKTF